MQESRLFKIIYHLLHFGTSTAAELAEKFEVSARTIYRDIDVISSVGIPIYTTQGKGGGISIAKDFVLTKSLLTSNEKEQVLMALQGLAAIENKNEELLTKLGSLFQCPETNWIEVDFSNWTKTNINQDNFNYLKQAIWEKNIVNFQYFGSNQKVSNRKIAPLKLIFKSRDWYLYGFCMSKEDYRLFKLTRIKSITITVEKYSHNIKIPSVAIKQINIENTIPALLKFDTRVAFRVYDEFAEDATLAEDGFLYVRTNLPNNDMLYSYILSFENYVEVIEPVEIRERIKKKILNISLKYVT